VGASRYRRHRLRLAAERHQQELGLRLGVRLLDQLVAEDYEGERVLSGSSANGDDRNPFYHSSTSARPRAATLLEKPRARLADRGPAASEERVEALDAHLWTYRDDGFLPTGPIARAETAAQPVLLTIHEHNPNRANVRFLIDGAPLPADVADYHRIVLLFDGTDDDAVAPGARALGHAKAAGTRSPIGSPTSRAAGSRRLDRYSQSMIPKSDTGFRKDHAQTKR